MPLARDISSDLQTIGQPYSGHLTQSGIRLLRGHRLHLNANPSFLGGAFATHAPALQRIIIKAQRRRLDLLFRPLTSLPHKLIDGRQANPL
jgi:hypothetical protein